MSQHEPPRKADYQHPDAYRIDVWFDGERVPESVVEYDVDEGFIVVAVHDKDGQPIFDGLNLRLKKWYGHVKAHWAGYSTPCTTAVRND